MTFKRILRKNKGGYLPANFRKKTKIENIFRNMGLSSAKEIAENRGRALIPEKLIGKTSPSMLEKQETAGRTRKLSIIKEVRNAIIASALGAGLILSPSYGAAAKAEAAKTTNNKTTESREKKKEKKTPTVELSWLKNFVEEAYRKYDVTDEFFLFDANYTEHDLAEAVERQPDKVVRDRFGELYSASWRGGGLANKYNYYVNVVVTKVSWDEMDGVIININDSNTDKEIWGISLNNYDPKVYYKIPLNQHIKIFQAPVNVDYNGETRRINVLVVVSPKGTYVFYPKNINEPGVLGVEDVGLGPTGSVVPENFIDIKEGKGYLGLVRFHKKIVSLEEAKRNSFEEHLGTEIIEDYWFFSVGSDGGIKMIKDGHEYFKVVGSKIADKLEENGSKVATNTVNENR